MFPSLDISRGLNILRKPEFPQNIVPNTIIFVWLFGIKIPFESLLNIQQVCSVVQKLPNGKVYLYTNNISKANNIFVQAYGPDSMHTIFSNLKICSINDLIEHFQDNNERWIELLLHAIKPSHIPNNFSMTSEYDLYSATLKILSDLRLEKKLLNKICGRKTSLLTKYLITLIARESGGASNFAFVSDYLRLIALLKHGGVYMDADLWLQRFSDSLNLTYGIFVSDSYTSKGNDLIVATQENIYVMLMLFRMLLVYMSLFSNEELLLMNKAIENNPIIISSIISGLMSLRSLINHNFNNSQQMSGKQAPPSEQFHKFRRISPEWRVPLTILIGGVGAVANLTGLFETYHFAIREQIIYNGYSECRIKKPEEQQPKYFETLRDKLSVFISNLLDEKPKADEDAKKRIKRITIQVIGFLRYSQENHQYYCLEQILQEIIKESEKSARFNKLNNLWKDIVCLLNQEYQRRVRSIWYKTSQSPMQQNIKIAVRAPRKALFDLDVPYNYTCVFEVHSDHHAHTPSTWITKSRPRAFTI